LLLKGEDYAAMPRIGKCGIVDLKHLILQTTERGKDK